MRSPHPLVEALTIGEFKTSTKALLPLLFLLLLSISRACADGAYKHQLLAEPAQIPRQSAAISFADGKETLTIWNTVDAKGQELAWVLPLPAKPEVIRPSHPNAFKLLQLLTAPGVNVGMRSERLGTGFLLFLGLSLMLMKRPKRMQVVPAAVICLLLLGAVMFPAMSGTFGNPRGGVGPVAGVEIISAQDAGNYETTVISGTSAEVVNEWLRGEGFPGFTGGDAQVLASYVAKQWVFLCSKLKTTTTGPSAGHPLSVRFPVEEPVYPMSLTKSAGTVPVEIFWMGEAVCDPSGRLALAGAARHNASGLFGNLHNEYIRRAEARAAHGVPGFESLKEYYIEEDKDLLLDQLARSSVLRFTATFTPASDWSDIQFEPVREMPEIPRHVTRRWLLDQVLDRAALPVTTAVLLLGFAAQFCGKHGTRPHIAWAATGLVMLLGAAGVAWSQRPKDVVIVENSQVRLPARDGPGAPEELLNDWIKSVKEAKSLK